MQTQWGPLLIELMLSGHYLKRSPHLRTADADNLNGHANNISDTSALESETMFLHAIRTEIWISPACFLWRWWVISHDFASASNISKSEAARYVRTVARMDFQKEVTHEFKCDFATGLVSFTVVDVFCFCARTSYCSKNSLGDVRKKISTDHTPHLPIGSFLILRKSEIFHTL